MIRVDNHDGKIKTQQSLFASATGMAILMTRYIQASFCEPTLADGFSECGGLRHMLRTLNFDEVTDSDVSPKQGKDLQPGWEVYEGKEEWHPLAVS